MDIYFAVVEMRVLDGALQSLEELVKFSPVVEAIRELAVLARDDVLQERQT